MGLEYKNFWKKEKKKTRDEIFCSRIAGKIKATIEELDENQSLLKARARITIMIALGLILREKVAGRSKGFPVVLNLVINWMGHCPRVLALQGFLVRIRIKKGQAHSLADTALECIVSFLL